MVGTYAAPAFSWGPFVACHVPLCLFSTFHIHVAHCFLSNHFTLWSSLIMGASHLADPEKNADGTKELYLCFVLPTAFLSVSAVENLDSPVQTTEWSLQTPPLIWFPGRFYKPGTACSYWGSRSCSTEPATHSRFSTSIVIKIRPVRKASKEAVHECSQLQRGRKQEIKRMFQLKKLFLQVAAAISEPIWSCNM